MNADKNLNRQDAKAAGTALMAPLIVRQFLSSVTAFIGAPRRTSAVALSFAVFCSFAAAFAASLFFAPYPVPAFDSVRGEWRSSDAWLLDRHGEPLSRVRI